VLRPAKQPKIESLLPNKREWKVPIVSYGEDNFNCKDHCVHVAHFTLGISSPTGNNNSSKNFPEIGERFLFCRNIGFIFCFFSKAKTKYSKSEAYNMQLKKEQPQRTLPL
jgi:hypothetical protein